MVNLFTQKQVYELCKYVGFTDANAKIGAAIAMCEGAYSQDGKSYSNFAAVGDQALANDVWGYSYGGFQIRSLRQEKGTGGYRDEEKLIDPVFNATSARAIKLKSGWGAWSTYTGGQYKAYLQDEFPPPPNSYVVISGDTLSKIATKLGNKFSWQDLAKTNGIVSPYTIYIGQVLLLPYTSTGV